MIDNETLRRMAKGPTQFPAVELRDALEELIARREQEQAKEEGWVVVNNITGQPVSKVFHTEDNANHLCGAMNLDAGPGGLYGVKPAS